MHTTSAITLSKTPAYPFISQPLDLVIYSVTLSDFYLTWGNFLCMMAIWQEDGKKSRITVILLFLLTNEKPWLSDHVYCKRRWRQRNIPPSCSLVRLLYSSLPWLIITCLTGEWRTIEATCLTLSDLASLLAISYIILPRIPRKYESIPDKSKQIVLQSTKFFNTSSIPRIAPSNI